MKPLVFLLALLPFGSSAQNVVYDYPPTPYAILSAGLGNVFGFEPARDLAISFNYTSTPAGGGSPTAHTFNSSLSGTQHRDMPMADLFHLEWISGRSDLEVYGGMNRDAGNNWSGYYEMGYRYMFTTHHFQIKPGIGLRGIFDHSQFLGAIDNLGQGVNLFGYNCNDQFTVTTGDDDDAQVTTIYNADRLDVDYSRQSGFLTPSVVLSSPPEWMFSFSLELGYFVEIGQSNFLKLVQRGGSDDSESNDVGNVDLNFRNGVLSGPYVGCSIGVILGRRKAV